MANEISYQLQTSLSHTGVSDNYSTGSKTITQTTAGLVKNVQGITTNVAGDALDLGSIGTPGFAYFVNLDTAGSSETITIGSQVGGTYYPLIKLKATECCMFRLNGTPYAKSSAGTIDLMYAIYES